jgi:hypothetical protein
MLQQFWGIGIVSPISPLSPLEKIARKIHQVVTAIDSALQSIPHPIEILACI